MSTSSFLEHFRRWDRISSTSGLRKDETRQHVANLNANTAQPGVSQGKLKTLGFVQPPSEVASQFNEDVEPVVRQIFLLARVKQRLSEARDLLFRPRLMSWRGGSVNQEHAEASDLVALGKGLATEFKCYKPCSRQQNMPADRQGPGVAGSFQAGAMSPSPYTEDNLVQLTTADYLERQLGLAIGLCL